MRPQSAIEQWKAVAAKRPGVMFRKVKPADVAAAERKLKMRFPASYVELVTTLGAPALSPNNDTASSKLAANLPFAVLRPQEVVAFTAELRSSVHAGMLEDRTQLKRIKDMVNRAVVFQLGSNASEGYVFLLDRPTRDGEIKVGFYYHDALEEIDWSKAGPLQFGSFAASTADAIAGIERHFAAIAKLHAEHAGKRSDAESFAAQTAGTGLGELMAASLGRMTINLERFRGKAPTEAMDQPLDPALRDFYGRAKSLQLSSKEFDCYFFALTGSLNLGWQNRRLRKLKKDDPRSLAYDGLVAFTTFLDPGMLATVPALRDAQGRQPVLFIPSEDARRAVPIASSVDGALRLMARSAAAGKRAKFPDALSRVIAEDEALSKQIRAGAFGAWTR